MAKDYTIRFTGQDDLSNTINKVKSELKDIGSSTVNIDKIDEKFKKIESSAAPLKRKLKDLQAIMADMNLKGLSNTDQFSKIAQQAGKYKDAISDAKQATTNFANDTFKLEAGVQAFEGLAGAASIATGAMGLLGSENKNVQQAILKVQGALGILNGVQSVANVLNKDSALMLRLKSIWAQANAASTTKSTVAETANTIATGANTTGIIANTAAERAWNITKAIGQALLGNWAGLVLVGAAALGTYALATKSSTDAEKEHTGSLNESSNAANTYKNKYNETATSLISNYQQLKIEWNNLSNAQQKAKWIKDNQTKFDELGVSVLNTADAENVFVNNTSKMIKSFQLRAQAAANATLAQQSYQKAISSVRYVQVKKGEFLSGDKLKVAIKSRVAYKKNNGSNYANGNTSGMVGNIKSYNDNVKEANQYIKQEVDLIKQADSLSGGKSVRSSGSTSKIKNTSGKGTTKPTVNIPQDSIKGIDNQISALQNKMSLATDTGVIAGYNKAIAKLQAKKEVLEFTANIIGLKEANSKIPEASKNLKGKNKTNTLDSNILNPDQNKPLDSNILNPNQNKLNSIGSIADIKNQIQQQQNIIDNNSNSETRNKAYAKKSDLEKELKGLDTSPLDDAQKRTEGIETAAKDAAQAFSQLGQSIGGVAGAGINIAGLMAQAIVTMIQGYATATSQAASLGPWAWIAFGALGLAQLATMIATVKSAGAFADGGIISGNSYHGDGLLANVNAGEMILNTKQQANLFRMLDGTKDTTNSSGVTFKIQGKELVGVLNNYNSKTNKIR